MTDTATKRVSAINHGCPWRGLLSVPDGTIDQGDRQEIAYLYTGILASGSVVPPVVIEEVRRRAGPTAPENRYDNRKYYPTPKTRKPQKEPEVIQAEQAKTVVRDFVPSGIEIALQAQIAELSAKVLAANEAARAEIAAEIADIQAQLGVEQANNTAIAILLLSL